MENSTNMNSLTISNSAMKRDNVSASANVLMCKQWWKVCWMYGDQEKYYRQLYGKRGEKKFTLPDCKKKFGPLEKSELSQNFYENANVKNHSDLLQINESFSVEEVCSPSPSHGRNSSPGIHSLELARGLDE